VFCAQPDPPGRSVVETTILRRGLDESLRGVNEGRHSRGARFGKIRCRKIHKGL
jgi:hypothetical protein